MLKDCLGSGAPVIFLALSILNQFVNRSPTLSERRDQKELQDIAGKLIEACANIGGACLEQTNWLRRNLAVKSELLPSDSNDDQENTEATSVQDEKSVDTGSMLSIASVFSSSEGSGKSGGKNASQYAVTALNLLGKASYILLIHFANPLSRKVVIIIFIYVFRLYVRHHVSKSRKTKQVLCENSDRFWLDAGLAEGIIEGTLLLVLAGELLAPLLDIIFHSEEKDKVLPLLYNVMANVMPYLRNHSKSNSASYRACAKLLASLSEYQYTRKAWKKDSLELLLDPMFFQVCQILYNSRKFLAKMSVFGGFLSVDGLFHSFIIVF